MTERQKRPSPVMHQKQFDPASKLNRLCGSPEIDPRRLVVLCALILGMIQTRSVVLWRLVPVVQLGENENSVYKRLKRFMQYSLSQNMMARFVLSFLREEHVLLLLDRTNWKWGQQDINFLILSVS